MKIRLTSINIPRNYLTIHPSFLFKKPIGFLKRKEGCAVGIPYTLGFTQG
jgi:hypothetical protein